MNGEPGNGKGRGAACCAPAVWLSDWVSLFLAVSLAAQDSTFVLTTTDPTYRAPAFLGNGAFSLVGTPLGTTPSLSFAAGVYEHAPGDGPRLAALPAWSEIDVSDGDGWLNETRPDTSALQNYRQTLDLYDGNLSTSYEWVPGGRDPRRDSGAPRTAVRRARHAAIPAAGMATAPATRARAPGALRAAVDTRLGLVSRTPRGDRRGFAFDPGPRRGRDDSRSRRAAADVVGPAPAPATQRDRGLVRRRAGRVRHIHEARGRRVVARPIRSAGAGARGRATRRGARVSHPRRRPHRRLAPAVADGRRRARRPRAAARHSRDAVLSAREGARGHGREYPADGAFERGLLRPCLLGRGHLDVPGARGAASRSGPLDGHVPLPGARRGRAERARQRLPRRDVSVGVGRAGRGDDAQVRLAERAVREPRDGRRGARAVAVLPRLRRFDLARPLRRARVAGDGGFLGQPGDLRCREAALRDPPRRVGGRRADRRGERYVHQRHRAPDPRARGARAPPRGPRTPPHVDPGGGGPVHPVRFRRPVSPHVRRRTAGQAWLGGAAARLSARHPDERADEAQRPAGGDRTTPERGLRRDDDHQPLPGDRRRAGRPGAGRSSAAALLPRSCATAIRRALRDAHQPGGALPGWWASRRARR